MSIKETRKKQKKERYEVLYEELNSNVKQIAEGVIGLKEDMQKMKDEIQGEIYEFKQDVNAHFRLLDNTLIDLKEEVKINRKWILQNQTAIKQNRESIEKNGEAIERVDKKLSIHDETLKRHDVMLKKHDKLLANA